MKENRAHILCRVWLCLALVGALAGCASLSGGGKPPAPVVFLTDFGVVDDAVAICKGVMLGIEPRLTVVDLTHDVPPQNLRDAARFLSGAAAYYPQGTVFVVVVDPGVGSARKAIAAKSRKGHYFVVPDNGVLTDVADRDGLVEVREIANRDWMIQKAVSSTFHGRDIFSPVGAHLAAGRDFSEVGPVLTQWVRLEPLKPKLTSRGAEARIVGVDGPFGNLISNLRGEQLRELGYDFGDSLKVRMGKRQVEVPFHKTFSRVPVGKPLAYVDSKGFVAFAVNQGHFANTYRLTPPLELFVPRKSSR